MWKRMPLKCSIIMFFYTYNSRSPQTYRPWTGDFNSGGPAAGRKKTDFEDDIGGFGVRLVPHPQSRSCHYKQRAPAAETETTQRRGGRRRTSRMTLADLESGSPSLPQHRRHHKQRAPAAETETTQRRGGRRRTTPSTALESDSFPPTVVEECQKDHS